MPEPRFRDVKEGAECAAPWRHTGRYRLDKGRRVGLTQTSTLIFGLFGLLTAIGTTIGLMYSGIFAWTDVALMLAILLSALIVVSIAMIVRSMLPGRG